MWWKMDLTRITGGILPIITAVISLLIGYVWFSGAWKSERFSARPATGYAVEERYVTREEFHQRLRQISEPARRSELVNRAADSLDVGIGLLLETRLSDMEDKLGEIEKLIVDSPEKVIAVSRLQDRFEGLQKQHGNDLENVNGELGSLADSYNTIIPDPALALRVAV